MPCTCINGGTCLDDSIFQICECPSGFEGDLCEDLIADVTHKNLDSNLDKIAIVFGALLLVFISTILCYFICRKIYAIRKRKMEELKTQNRRQSKATIEGVTIDGYGNEYVDKCTKIGEATKVSIENEKTSPDNSNSVINSSAVERT